MVWFKDGLDEEQLKKEYRRLCMKYHPDVSKDPNAEEIFKEIGNQFDQYYVNQRVREFEWVDLERQMTKARKVRGTILMYLIRDPQHEGRYYGIVDATVYNFWGITVKRAKKGITTDEPEWSGFHGGLAYCSYTDTDDIEGHPSIGTVELVHLHKLPATLTPASAEEIYFYNKDHWLDSVAEYYEYIQCRFGKFWAQTTDRGDFYFYIKAELPDEFLKIGNTMDQQEEARYAARSIKKVYVRKRWIQNFCKELDQSSGKDFAYRLYQDCTAEDFIRYHYVDYQPRFAEAMPLERIEKDFWFVPDPIIAYFAQKGVVKFYRSKQNFRKIFGTFNSFALRQHMHLLSIEDAEIIQDYLCGINPEFDEYIKQQARAGKIKIDTSRKKRAWEY